QGHNNTSSFAGGFLRGSEEHGHDCEHECEPKDNAEAEGMPKLKVEEQPEAKDPDDEQEEVEEEVPKNQPGACQVNPADVSVCHHTALSVLLHIHCLSLVIESEFSIRCQLGIEFNLFAVGVFDDDRPGDTISVRPAPRLSQ